MRKLHMTQVACEFAKAIKKPVMFISCHLVYSEVEYGDIHKAAPYLTFEDDAQLIGDGQGIIVCEDEEEMDRLFKQTVGDDGPTKTNPYEGLARVYALTINAKGEMMTENT